MAGRFDILSFQVSIYRVYAYVRIFSPVTPFSLLIFPYFSKRDFDVEME
jgi:hypothetical protein